ncbi:MAG: GxxExxY protein [Lentisphaerae bacterium RIFOXYA12_FULL_48_11]|nr:MAG: GxxExxY protein [Lentisphaerae bacterium RIFOXYA12_FULL_48_11]
MNSSNRKYDLAGQVIGLAMKVHSALGPGFLESVYQNALAFELREAGLKVELEKDITVKYRDTVIGTFVADMLVDNRVVVENKAVQTLAVAHEVQLVNYLTATGIDEGLLLNFGSPKLEYKKKFRKRSSVNKAPF